MLTETSAKKGVTKKFANQDSSRSVYWIVTREERERKREKEEKVWGKGTEAEGTGTL